MPLYQIKHRFTGSVLFEKSADSLRLCVEAAVQAHTNLRYSDLSGTNLSGSNLSGSDLRSSNLSGSDLRSSNLSGTNLSGSNLSGSDLRGSNLSGTNLSGSNLRYSNLSGSNLSCSAGIADVLSIGPIGSRRDYVTATVTPDGVRVSTGCFTGSLYEFRSAVAATHGTHGDNEHGRHYRAAIALIEARFSPEVL